VGAADRREEGEPTSNEVSADAYLAMLASESARTREDDRLGFVQFLSIIGIGLALVLASATLLFGTCAEGSEACHPDTPAAVDGAESAQAAPAAHVRAVPVIVYLAAPILPLILLAFGINIAAQQTLRSYYLRDLEVEIQRFAGREKEVPAWAHLQMETDGQHDALPIYRANWLLLWLVVFALVIGAIFMYGAKIPDPRLRAFALIADAAIIAIPIGAACQALQGARVWRQALDRLPDRLQRTRQGFSEQRSGRPGTRSFLGWLVLPRREEELMKALFIPIMAGFAWIVSPAASWSPIKVLGLLFVVELCAYQARYMWNDVRDREVDAAGALAKKRFPLGETPGETARRVQMAFVVFLLRIVTAVVVIFLLLPADEYAWAWYAAFAIAVFAIGVPYEHLRAALDRPGPTESALLVWVLTIVVGLGYGLRATAGLWAAGIEPGWLYAVVFAGGSVFGSLFVSMTWALESTRLPASTPAGRGDRSTSKDHLSFYRAQVVKDRPTGVDATTKVLEPAQPWLAPWTISGIVAAGLLSIFVLSLAAGGELRLLSFAVALLAALVTAVSFRTPAFGSWFFALGLGAAIGVLGATVAPELRSPMWAGLAMGLMGALAILTAAVFRSQSYEDLRAIFRTEPFTELAASAFGAFSRVRDTTTAQPGASPATKSSSRADEAGES
jgi:hypothetical protein